MEARFALLAWFDRHHRALPWRSVGPTADSPIDPYAVWVSEIMLQQTRVETVIPYFERFLARFPGLASLAEAEEAEVLALWSGLGYYRRCRSLLAAAKQVVAGGGRLPENARGLERLPGIGPYTAAAIASIAFGEAVPVLDGNVERVLCRYSARPAGGRRKRDRDQLLGLAAELLDRRRPGDSNQALMELGATICTPRAPRCPSCPLAPDCQARALDAAESYPAPERRADPERVRQLVAFVEENGRLLLFRRSANSSQLAGLWEFPAVELGGHRAAEAELSGRFGGQWTLGPELVRLRHAITKRTFAIEVRRAAIRTADDSVGESGPRYDSGDGTGRPEPGWWSRDELAGLALTGLARKLLARRESQPA